MAKSLRKKLEGNETQKVQELKVFGWNTFCDLEGYGPDTVQRWFQNQKGCETDSIFNYPSLPASLSDLCGRDRAMLAVQKLISGFEGHISRLEARDKERDELILHLKNPLNSKLLKRLYPLILSSGNAIGFHLASRNPVFAK